MRNLTTMEKSLFLEMLLGGRQRCAGAGLQGLVASLPPSSGNGIFSWWFETGHRASVYTMKTSKHYESKPPRTDC